MTATRTILSKLGVSTSNASKYAAVLDAAMAEFNINTKTRKAMFIAQLMHESGRLSTIVENLNYRADRLLVVFPKYFKTQAEANAYAKQPAKIANRVYANRMGNGNEASGDGYRFRGRGAIQLTGKDNYTRCGTALNKDLVSNPDYLETPEGAVRSAAWFWASNGLNKLADSNDFVAVTKRINGGTNGLADRKSYYAKALALM